MCTKKDDVLSNRRHGSTEIRPPIDAIRKENEEIRPPIDAREKVRQTDFSAPEIPKKPKYRNPI